MTQARRGTDAAAALRRPPPEECQTWSSCLGTNQRPTILRRTESPHASAPICTTMPLPNPRPRYPAESLAHARRAPADPTPVISHLTLSPHSSSWLSDVICLLTAAFLRCKQQLHEEGQGALKGVESPAKTRQRDYEPLASVVTTAKHSDSEERAAQLEWSDAHAPQRQGHLRH